MKQTLSETSAKSATPRTWTRLAAKISIRRRLYCAADCDSKMSAEKKSIALKEDEWQVVLDSLSNTVFNEEFTEDARKKAKELFVKLQKELPRK